MNTSSRVSAALYTPENAKSGQTNLYPSVALYNLWPKFKVASLIVMAKRWQRFVFLCVVHPHPMPVARHRSGTLLPSLYGHALHYATLGQIEPKIFCGPIRFVFST